METNACEVKVPHKEQTVGENLDYHIKRAREQVEQLCVLKAKAECLGVLDHPIDFYHSLSLF